MTNVPFELDHLFRDCLAQLLNGTRHEIEHVRPGSDVKNALPASVPDTVNIYALWERPKDSTEWLLRYVGQRMSKAGRSRVHEHLFRCYSGTHSKRSLVKAALDSGSTMAVTTLHVSPDPMRLAVEEFLLAHVPQEHLWNKKLLAGQGGRARKTKKVAEAVL